MTLRRRIIFSIAVISLASVLYLGTSGAMAQARQFRIGFLTSASPDAYQPSVESLLAALREHGYVQGKNMVLLQRSSEQAASLHKHASELAETPVDVIVTWGTPATAAAQSATRRIAIVMANTADPLASKFVQSLAHPGANVTGISSLSTDLSGKVVSLLKEIFPKAARLGVFRNPANPATSRHLQVAQQAAKSLGVQLVVAEVHGGDLGAAFSKLSSARVDAAIALADPTFVSQRQEFATLALRHGLPVAFQRSENVVAGGLISYSADLREQFRLAASYVHRILQGTPPSDLPVIQPVKVELVANLRTARALGITIPPAVLLRADRVIE